MTLIKVLTAAKPYLCKGRSTHKSPYICFAIDKAQDAGAITGWEAKMVQKHLGKLLYPHATAFGWLNSNVHRTFSDYSAVQQYRHRWVDHMIEEARKELASS